jgi:hypothetical protein
MSPRFDNRKTLKVIKPAIAGRSLVWFYQGTEPVKPVVLKSVSSIAPLCLATIGEREPDPLPGESFEDFLDRLYAPIQEAR